MYDDSFYDEIDSGARPAAKRIVPHVMAALSPGSVVDFGCAHGAWLAEFAAAGAEILGIDGDGVDRERLVIPLDRFMVHDLSDPPILKDRFDLAVSLEVAEHLPVRAAADFVAALVHASDHVLFGAALPGQAGTSHINEQWPSYWAHLFRAHGYHPRDLIRPHFADATDVKWWYRQNTFLYVRDAQPEPIALDLATREFVEILLAAERARCGPNPSFSVRVARSVRAALRHLAGSSGSADPLAPRQR